MLRFMVYLTGLIITSGLSWQAAKIAESSGSTYQNQIIVFIFTAMICMVITILVVESDTNQTGWYFRFYRWIGRRLGWFYNVCDYLAQGVLIVFRLDISDNLQVYVNGEQKYVWHVGGRVPREVLDLGITEADCNRAIKGSTVYFHNDKGLIEIMPVAFGYKSRLVIRE